MYALYVFNLRFGAFGRLVKVAFFETLESSDVLNSILVRSRCLGTRKILVRLCLNLVPERKD